MSKKRYRVMVSARKDYWRDFIVKADSPEDARRVALEEAAMELGFGGWNESALTDLQIEGRVEELVEEGEYVSSED